MGVIQRQSFKYTVVNLVGLLIGVASTLFIYPHVTEAYGMFQWMLSMGILGLPLLSMGANLVAVRFFPRFDDPASGHHGFLPLLLTLCAVGSGLALLALLLLWPWISAGFEGDPLKTGYAWVAFPVAVLYTLNAVLFQYSTNFNRIVVPSILIDFSLKIVQPLLLLGVWMGWMPVGWAVYGLLIYHFLVFGGMFVYLRVALRQWHWRPDPAFLDDGMRRELGAYILGFGAFGQLAVQMASRLDTFLVGSISTLSNAGVYNIALNIAAVVEIPIKALYGASVGSVSRYINSQDWEALGDLYRKVSINLLIAGLLILGGVLVSVDDLYLLIANREAVAVGKIVLVLIGFSRLVEMSTGLNNYIMFYSAHYRLSLAAQGAAAVFNLVLSVWLIPRYGIAGAAWSALLSIAGYNAVNVWLVWVKFGLFPFTRATLVGVAIGVVAFVLAWLIPRTEWPLLNMVVRSGAFALLFMAPVLYLRVSADMNGMLAAVWGRIGSWMRR
ncbi:MAG: polysaccharide biosynthesis C-terminal domain-containing protein [Saprospiraceae bacterium]|nr:polysaccharide biosynthesis C-terminal domain-containing protein [Saprospiraceae bacterium]